ncbi:hypothetical protein LEMA_P066590.1 [Plenodomus lingam JN3]|uniref:Mitochondrial outer membrane translocase complex, subunit Tom5 n=1 Tax=Leptosphaeria maculans (strain JN3 / isolate v23.1.3 / race Av1-4-5-6-7-8) TaxID=985895 RepID=E4ZGW3_LEPMJ|nr:hypothetical protein LEMA_P066590.1 [Plenodomus lingam JN3]CBX90533.1 hypothetical protein LEMA_P066590.1 [Plenodomus lingam JN3]
MARDPIYISGPWQITEIGDKKFRDDTNVILKTRKNPSQQPVAPPEPSKRELELAEAQTLADIKWTAASAIVLYFSPHLVEYVSKLF